MMTTELARAIADITSVLAYAIATKTPPHHIADAMERLHKLNESNGKIANAIEATPNWS